MTIQPAPTAIPPGQAIHANHALDAVPRQLFQTEYIRELLLGSEPERAMQDVATYLRTYAESGLRSALQSLLADSSALQAIAECSYFHGNGFYKVVLAQDERFKLRLHIWMPGGHAEENIHDHRWHFASTIVHGQLVSEIWQEATQPEATEFDEILYLAKELDSPPFQIPNGKTKLLCTQRAVRTAGEAYAMPPGVLHRIVSTGNGLTATLMCQAAPARRWNRLIPHAAITPDITQRYQSVVEMSDVIHKLLLLLQTR